MRSANIPPRGFHNFPPPKEDGSGVRATKKDIADSEARHEKQMKILHILLTGVIIVLFTALLTVVFALGSMFIDNWRYQSENYKDYVETIRVQGLVVEQHNKERGELIELIQGLSTKIDALESKSKK